MTARWTKADRRRAHEALDGFRLCAGGIGVDGHVRADVKDGAEGRAAAVYLDFLAQRSEDRALQNDDTASHAAANPSVWKDGTDEIVERFTKLALEERSKAKKLRALAGRLRTEGMPPPVEK